MSSCCSSLVEVGFDHLCVDQETLGRACRAVDEGSGLPRVPAGVGVVTLRTCHRVELYLEGADALASVELLRGWLGWNPDEAARVPVGVRSGSAAARHLLRVTAGLESAVLGEDQILCQVRAAYRSACALRNAGPVLHRLFHAAFRAGKRVRSETAIAAGGRSLAGAAVGFLQEELGSLDGRTVLILGAGEMGSLAAKRLCKRGAGRLLVANRTWARARSLAASVCGDAVPWEWRSGAMGRSDAVLCATGAGSPVVLASDLIAAAERRAKPLVVVDLAVPGNVERPACAAPRVRLAGVEELKLRLARQAEVRVEAVAAAERIIEEELGRWLAQQRSRPVVRGRAG